MGTVGSNVYIESGSHDTENAISGSVAGGCLRSLGTANSGACIGGASGVALPLGTNDFSVSIWGRWDAEQAGNWSSFCGQRDGTDGWNIRNNNGTEKVGIFLDYGAGTLSAYSAAAMEIGKWYHIAATFARDGFATLYINGEYENKVDISAHSSVNLTTTPSGVDGTGAFTVLYDTANNDEVNGAVDECRVYNTLLTQPQIKALYTGDKIRNTTKITGEDISTGKIKSNNWGAAAGSKIDLDDGTIKLGGSSNPAFDVTSLGLVTATNFGRNTVTVLADGTNLANYAKSVAGGVNLVFDGSEGGDICMHMILKKHPGDLIKGFDLPQSATGLDCTVTVDVQVTGVKFDDATIAPDLLAMNEFVAPP